MAQQSFQRHHVYILILDIVRKSFLFTSYYDGHSLISFEDQKCVKPNPCDKCCDCHVCFAGESRVLPVDLMLRIDHL